MGICYMSQETQTGNLHHLEGWDGVAGREVPEGGDICIPMADWASLIAQLVKNLPEMQETPVQFLGQKGPLEKG